MQATTVAATGTAETKFNQVTFSVHLSEDGKTVPQAKQKLELAIKGLNEAVDAAKKELDLEFIKNSLRTSSNTRENWEWVGKNNNKQELQGYTMNYSLAFSIDDLEKVAKVYDALTSIPKVQVMQPAFSLKIKNRERLNNRALKAAWKKVEERFQSECEILGLNPADFQIGNWETSYSDSQRSDRVAKSNRVGAMRAMATAAAVADDEAVESAAGPQEPSIGFSVGLASVTVNLEVGYIRKAQ